MLYQAKIQGLFKNFPGPLLEILKTFLWQFTSNQVKCSCWMTPACHCHPNKPQNTYRNTRKRAWKHLQTRHALPTSSSTYMRKSNEREQWEWKTCFRTFVCIEDAKLCLWTFIFIDIFPSRSIKNSRTLKDRKPILSTFKALKSDPWNSRVSRGFQDVYEPWI